MKAPRHCLDCGRDMTLDEWYQTCNDSALTDENMQEGLEYPDECY